MAVTAAGMISDFDSLMSEIGQNIRIKKYSEAYAVSGTGWDDGTTLTQSGSATYAVGFTQPLTTDTSGFDYKYLQEGKLQTDDSKLFLTGSVNLSGNRIKFAIGSPNYVEYVMLFKGDRKHNIAGTTVYNDVYIRILNNGSFIGE